MFFSNLSGRLLVILVLTQVGFVWGAKKKNPSGGGGNNMEAGRVIAERIKAASREDLVKGTREASKKLEKNFARGLLPMTRKNAKSIPVEIRENAKEIQIAVKAGELNDAIFAALPSILASSGNRTRPAQQLTTILGELIPRAPVDLKNPLQGVMDFVRANMNGVNKLLSSTVNGVPNLLNGVVGSLANTLGGVSTALNGSMDSLNGLVGGLLSSLPTGGAGGLLG